MLSLWVGLHPHPGSGRVLFCSAAAAGAAEALSSSTVATVTARPQTADLGMHDIAITDHFIVKSDAVLTLRKVRLSGALLPDRKSFREIGGNNLKCRAFAE